MRQIVPSSCEMGSVEATHGASYVFDDDQMLSYVDCHLNKEFGLLSRYDVEQNLRALETGRPIISVYECDHDRFLIIQTFHARKLDSAAMDLSQASTVCFLLEEL